MNLPSLAAPLATLAQAAQKVSEPMSSDVSGSYWFPPQASTLAAESDWIFYYIYWVSVIFTSIIVGVMIFFVLRYRHRKNWDGEKSASHGLALEITWSVIPFLLTIVMWWKGFESYMIGNTVPDNAFTINVQARQWSWNFVYPSGLETTELHVPEGEDVVFVMESADVIHSFWVPAWRVKKDVVPGRYTKTWVNATEPGTYTLFCTEYCGLDHSAMLSTVIVHPSKERRDALLEAGETFTYDMAPYAKTFEEWYAEETEKSSNIADQFDELWQYGEYVYTQRACNACHTIDGTTLVGPTWKGVWGTERTFEDGSTAIFDENYAKDSIYDPGDQVVAGFPATMTTYRGVVKQKELNALIAYFKHLAE